MQCPTNADADGQVKSPGQALPAKAFFAAAPTTANSTESSWTDDKSTPVSESAAVPASLAVSLPARSFAGPNLVAQEESDSQEQSHTDDQFSDTANSNAQLRDNASDDTLEYDKPIISAAEDAVSKLMVISLEDTVTWDKAINDAIRGLTYLKGLWQRLELKRKQLTRSALGARGRGRGSWRGRWRGRGR